MPVDDLDMLVDAVERDVTRTGFRGCPFNNVSSEYDDPQHPARSAAAAPIPCS